MYWVISFVAKDEEFVRHLQYGEKQLLAAVTFTLT